MASVQNSMDRMYRKKLENNNQVEATDPQKGGGV